MSNNYDDKLDKQTNKQTSCHDYEKRQYVLDYDDY